MGRTIRMCLTWNARHDRPQYTLGQTCPACGGETRPAAPASFSPADPYGEYRRALKDRVHD